MEFGSRKWVSYAGWKVCGIIEPRYHPLARGKHMTDTVPGIPASPSDCFSRLCLSPLLGPLLVRLATLGDTLDDRLPVLVQVELGDLDLAGGDANGHALAVGLLTRDTLDVDNVLEAVHGGDLALTALVGAALDDDLVVLTDGDRADLQ